MINIVDVSFLQEFFQAEEIDDYDELMKFFKNFPDDYYDNNNIYYEHHHTIPKCEDPNSVETIKLPYYFHFKAHILRARESVGKVRGYNYSAAFMIANRKYNKNLKNTDKKEVSNLLRYFPLEIYEAKINHLSRSAFRLIERNKSLRGRTFDEIYGEERSSKIKKVLSEKTSVKNLNESSETRMKRKVSVKKYASHRPIDHNKHISESKIGKKVPKLGRKVIHLNTMTIYDTIKEASVQTGCPHSSIQKCCSNEFRQCKGNYWQYYILDIDYERIYLEKQQTK